MDNFFYILFASILFIGLYVVILILNNIEQRLREIQDRMGKDNRKGTD